MDELTEQEFQAQLAALERGEALPAGLPAEDAADLALAGRLLAQRVQPGPDLLAAVRRSTAALPPARRFRWPRFDLKAPTRRKSMSARRIPAWQRVAVGLAALVLAFGITMAAFPSARAAVLNLIRQIGGVTIVETEQYPHSPEQRQGGSMNMHDTSPDTAPEQLFTAQSCSLAEARALLPFDFAVPTWAPAGFVQDDQVRIFLPPEGMTDTVFLVDRLQVSWSDPSRPAYIYFYVAHCQVPDCEQRWLVGTDSADVVQVRGQEAALVRGSWDVDTQRYENSGMLNLLWKEGEVFYSLVGFESATSVDDLVHMAESMP